MTSEQAKELRAALMPLLSQNKEDTNRSIMRILDRIAEMEVDSILQAKADAEFNDWARGER